MAAIASRRMLTARSISLSLTVSGGMRRSTVARLGLTRSPRRSKPRPRTSLMPGKSRARELRPAVSRSPERRT